MRTALIRARKDVGLTQQQVADAIGKARATYTCYELGTRNPPASVWLRIAHLVGRSMEELLDEVTDGNTSDARSEHTGPRGRRPEGSIDGPEREVKTA